MTERKHKYLLLDELGHSGRRKMIPSLQQSEGQIISVPEKLSPLETTILSTVSLLQEYGVLEVEGYSLVRVMMPDESTSGPNYSTFYRAFKRLSDWGYLDLKRKLLPMKDTSMAANKTVLSLTQAGESRLTTEIPPTNGS